MTGQAYRDGPPDPNAPVWPGWRNLGAALLFAAVMLAPVALLWWWLG